MVLAIGTHLGSMEVTALIGRGGMGEVYRARDTKLKRDVAIKILPDEFSRDADRVSRFQREAEVLASLNHPNIAGIYDFQDANGSRYLVLELVEGETLAERIARGPVPIEEALGIVKRICEALEAAHEKGIIHRDLKPANVKVTPEGNVKVLDFGLAKAMAGTGPALSNSPTLVSGSIGGVIIGTAAYMSPEQARGKAVDRRTDLWAFGCVLYEMLTGRQLFNGETVSDIVARVLERDPDWNALPRDVPPNIRSLLRRCLKKSAADRLQNAGDARIEIEEALNQPFAPEAAAPGGGREMLAWTLAGLLAVTAAVSVFLQFRSRPEPAELASFKYSVFPPANTTFSIGGFSISPRGRRLVFSADNNLWLHEMDSLESRKLAGTASAGGVFWSPDEKSIGFFVDGKLKRMEVDIEGSARVLADAPTQRGGSWNQTGDIIFVPGSGGPIFRISASGGQASPVTPIKENSAATSRYYPSFLSDGRHFVFTQASAEHQELQIGSLDSAEVRSVPEIKYNARYVEPGYLFFGREGNVMAQQFDLKKGALVGDPVSIARSVVYSSSLAFTLFSVSQNGVVVYRTGSPFNENQLTWYDRNGKESGTIGTGMFINLRLSRDGKRLAIDRADLQSGLRDIWSMSLDRPVPSRLTFGPGNNQTPTWSPDASTVVYTTLRPDGPRLTLKTVNGSAVEEIAATNLRNVQDWSPDGQFLLTTVLNGETNSGYDVFMYSIKEKKASPFIATRFNEGQPRFSPDGKRVAYCSDESGRQEIYVQPFPATGQKWQVSTAGGHWPRWPSNGKELFYISPEGEVVSVEIHTASGIEVGVPKILFKHPVLLSTGAFGIVDPFDIAPDGNRFLLAVPKPEDIREPLSVITNWRKTR